MRSHIFLQIKTRLAISRTSAATYKVIEPISDAAKIVFAHESLFAYKMFVGSQSREPFNLKFSSCWLKCLLKAAKWLQPKCQMQLVR